MCRKMRMWLHFVIALLVFATLLNTACSRFPFRPQRATATPAPPTKAPTESPATLAAQSVPTNTPKAQPKLKLKYEEFPNVGFGMKYPAAWQSMRSTTAPEMVFTAKEDDAHLRVVVTALDDKVVPGAIPGILEEQIEDIGAKYPDMELEETVGTVLATDARGRFRTYSIEQDDEAVTYRLAVLANENGRGYRVVTSAPANEFPNYAEIYDEMIESLTYLAVPAVTAKATATPPAALPLVKYEGEDFTIIYPEGWQIYPSAAQPEMLIAPEPPAPREGPGMLGAVITHLGQEQNTPDTLLNAYNAQYKSDGFVQVGTREAVLTEGATGSLEHYHGTQDADMEGEPLHYVVSFLTGPNAQTYRLVQYCPLDEYDEYAETFKEMRLSFAPAGGTVPEPAVTFAGDCEDATLPALLVGARDEYPATLTLMDFAGQAMCDFELQQTVADEFDTAAGAIYYERRDTNGAAVVMRISAEGEVDALNFTASAPALTSYNFLVSDDGTRIAWSTASELQTAEARVVPRRLVNNLYVADINGENQVNVLEGVPLGEEQVLSPVRFSANGTAVYIAAHQEDIFSPAVQWNALMRVRFAAPNQIEQIFNCGAGNSGCIHDFSPNERWIAYHNAAGQMAFRAVDNPSDMVITDAPTGNVACCGKFNPSGTDFVYYVANDNDTAYLVSHPPTHSATSVILTQGPRLAPFVAWADDTRLIFGLYNDENVANHRLLNLRASEIVSLNGDYLGTLDVRKMP